MNEPVWRERCNYCGEEKGGHIACCGENHFEALPECPYCSDLVIGSNSTTAGIETTVFKCSCGWSSDPE